MWLQGRAIYMFSRLYNEVEKRGEWLDAARTGVEFIKKHGRDPATGHVYFATTRDGVACGWQRKPYGAVFFVQGYLEYSHASGDKWCKQEALSLFDSIREWIKNPALLGRPVPAASAEGNVTSLADVMVQASLALEFLAKGIGDREKMIQIIREQLQSCKRHYSSKYNVLMERSHEVKGTSYETNDMRLLNPGHSLEVSWFMLHCLQYVPDDHESKEVALKALKGALQMGWDTEYGGITYFVDVQGKPVGALEAPMKLWWVHTEATYALLLAYITHPEDPEWKQWLVKVHDYMIQHFPDAQHGEWFGYLDRYGKVSVQLKGGSYKGFFHVPRFLLMAEQLIDQVL